MKPQPRLVTLWRSVQKPGSIATLVQGASTALLTQALSVGVIYLTQVLLARWMGVSAYGVYEYVGTLGILLSFLSGLGLSGAVLRFVSEYTVQENWSHLRGLIWGSWAQTLGVSLMTAGVGSWVVLALNISAEYRSALLWGMGLIPLVALVRLQLEMVRGTRQIALAYVPSMLLHPILFLAGAFIWVKAQGGLTSAHAIAISMAALLFTLVIQLVLFYRNLIPEIRQARTTFAFRKWMLVSLPLLLIDGSFLILNQTDTLMIGALLNTEAVGVYSAAFKTAAWVSFILMSVNAIAAPMFASLHAANDRQGLQDLVSTIARWMFYPALGVAIGLTVLADPVLQLFGSEFGVAKGALLVLMVGQLVNVGAGSVGYLLMMTGHHYQCARVVGLCAILNVVLNGIGIPYLGVLGAAIATAISMILWNVWLNRLVVKYLEIDPSIVGALRKR
jgi:O-antigen/teichoic acid export membrane protein